MPDKPVILAVDDDPQVLAAVARDLRRQYGEDYRIVRVTSGAEGLDAIEQLRAEGGTVALFVVDQRMPEMSGTEFLVQARTAYPDAKRVLLTAYADTEAAIAAINEVGLDHYLMKPWHPPEQNLYPVLDDLLDDWQASVPAPYHGIRVVATRWSSAAHQVKDFLARNQIPYRFDDVETQPEVRTELEGRKLSPSDLPVVLFPDGDVLVRPDHRALAARVGLQTEATNPFFDLIVIGAGPAGLGAAVYGASEGLRTAVLERDATGGQAGTSSRIENYLGFPRGISGSDLARRAAAQARRFGAEILNATEAVKVEVDDPTKSVLLADGTRLSCRSLVIASGMTLRRLEIPGAEELVGAGVYYGAAPSEAAEYRGEHVYVVGAANSAGQASMMLSRFAGHVTILARGTTIEKGMSSYLVDQIRATENIDVMTDTEVVKALGEKRLEGLVLRIGDREEEREASGLFIFIGARPHSDFCADVVATDAKGFVLTGPELRVEGRWHPAWPLERDPYLLETTVPGIFAAGDVRSGVVRRVASAVGQGAVCVSFVHQYLQTV